MLKVNEIEKWDEAMNQVVCGDCLDFMKLMPDKSVDLVLTDPPYDISDSAPGNSELMSLGKYKSKDFAEVTVGFDIDAFFEQTERLLPTANYFIFCSNKQISKLMAKGEELGYYTTLLVWHKPNSAPFANGVWRQDAEFIVHIREKGSYFQGGSEIKRKVVTRNLNPTEFGHPTEKPIDLIKRYITIGSDAPDIILDPFLGSGTTAVAAKQLGRKYIGVELSEKYCTIAEERLKQDLLF